MLPRMVEVECVCGEKHNIKTEVGGELPWCEVCRHIHYPTCHNLKKPCCKKLLKIVKEYRF